jgi:hypothetical protein
MPSFPPRWRDSARQFVCAESCGLRLRPRSSTSRVVIARLPYVRFRYSLVTRDHPFDGFVDRLQSLGFPPPCYPSYGAPTLTPVGLSPTECASLSWTHRPAQRSLKLQPADSPSRLMRPSTPEAPAALLPPPPLRLLPDGAIQFPGGTSSRCGPVPFHGAP